MHHIEVDVQTVLEVRHATNSVVEGEDNRFAIIAPQHINRHDDACDYLSLSQLYREQGRAIAQLLYSNLPAVTFNALLERMIELRDKGVD